MTPIEHALLLVIDVLVEKFDADNPDTKWAGTDDARRRAELVEAKRLITGDTP